VSSRAPAAEGGPAAARAGRAPASESTSSSASPFPPRAHSPSLSPSRPVPASPRADHIHPFFQKLFETGVDEMSWDDMVSERERSEFTLWRLHT